MSRLHLLSIVALTGSILALPADADEAAPEAPPSVERYQLKNRSSFKAPQVERAPFWPIGHVKMDKDSDGPEKPVIDILTPEMFAVTSILLGNPSLAVINGRAYGEGEFIRPSKASTKKGASSSTGVLNRVQRVQVVKISDGVVGLRTSAGQSFVVPLRRGELKEPKAEEELLRD